MLLSFKKRHRFVFCAFCCMFLGLMNLGCYEGSLWIRGLSRLRFIVRAAKGCGYMTDKSAPVSESSTGAERGKCGQAVDRLEGLFFD